MGGVKGFFASLLGGKNEKKPQAPKPQLMKASVLKKSAMKQEIKKM